MPSHNSTPGPYFHSAPSSQHASLHPAAASPVSSNKRTASSALGTGNGDPAGGGGSAAKKEKKLKGKWTEEEEKLLIKLRSSGMKWVDISQQNPGRSATACRLRYQNYTEKKEWAEDEKDMLARLYHRYALNFASPLTLMSWHLGVRWNGKRRAEDRRTSLSLFELSSG